MPLDPDLVDPEAGPIITISKQQLRTNKLCNIPASYHAPSEIKGVPMTVRPRPPLHPPARAAALPPLHTLLLLRRLRCLLPPCTCVRTSRS